jgi:hypothetical protein
MINETLYVISPFFIPRQPKSRIKLFKEFRSYVEFSGAQLLTVEVGYREHPYEVTCPCNPWDLQLHTDQEIWHKETAINRGIERLLELVPDAKYIAWVDGDVRFSNPTWVQDTINALQHYQIVQLFSEAQSLNPKYRSQWKCNSIFYNYVHNIGYSQHPPKNLKQYLGGGHPGLAWAARRETLEDLGGLLDFCVHGSADSHMANALMGDVTLYMTLGLKGDASKGFMDRVYEWQDRAERHVNRNIGYVDGICMHYWHGKPNKRGYEKRWSLIVFHKFDPNTDLIRCLNGLSRLRDTKIRFIQDLRISLSDRNEDGIDE